MAAIDPTDVLGLDRWPGPIIQDRNGGRDRIVAAVDYDSVRALQREVIAGASRVERDDDTGLLIADGASQTIAQYEFDASAGVATVAGFTDRLAALNDQPFIGTDEWAKSFALDGSAAAVLSADGKTYDAALCVVLIDNAGTRSLDWAFVVGAEADDGDEAAPTGQQIRDALGAATYANLDPNAFLVVGRVKIQRVAVDTITTTITDPASDDDLLNERTRGYCVAASA